MTPFLSVNFYSIVKEFSVNERVSILLASVLDPSPIFFQILYIHPPLMKASEMYVCHITTGP